MRIRSSRLAKTSIVRGVHLRCRAGQSAIETVFAALVVTVALMTAVALSQMLRARIVLDHAAARAARARSVGFNRFMCLKSARAAMIPVAGRRTWPPAEDGYEGSDVARVPIYLASSTPAEARGILDYDLWPRTEIDIATRHGLAPTATAYLRLASDDFDMDGSFETEAHYPLYMNEETP